MSSKELTFGLFCDSSNVPSYYATDGKVFTYDGNLRFVRSSHISNQCLMGFWNYPVVMDGWFINMKNTIPPKDIKFDIIFAAIERDTKNFDLLREQYPHAVICATIKEMKIENPMIRNYMIKEADCVVTPYFNYSTEVLFCAEREIKLAVTIPQPVNIKYLREHFLVDKNEHGFFDYNNFWVHGRGGHNRQVIDGLRTPYMVVRGKTEHPHPNQWRDFINMWKGCRYLLNLDPTPNFGQQATQCAALDVIVVGGRNDAHITLFPELAEMNHNYLLQRIDQMYHDNNYRNDVIAYARRILDAFYSFEAVKKSINHLYEIAR